MVPDPPASGGQDPIWPAAPYVIGVSTTRPRTGMPLMVTISGAQANYAMNVAIVAGAVDGGAPILLGTVCTDATGSGRQSFTVPSITPGAYTLTVIDPAASGGSATIALTVRPQVDPPDTTPPSSSSDSGSPSAADGATGGVDATSVASTATALDLGSDSGRGK